MQRMLKNSLDQVIRSTLDLLLPMRCLGCGQEGEFLCLCCTTALPRLEPPFCNICADPGVIGNCGSCREQARKGERMLEGIRAPYLLEGVIRAAVHSFKYRNVRAAAPCLGRLLAQYLAANPLPGDLLVPVPMHPRKLRQRGYNQACLLARELGKATGLPVDEKLLQRTRNTPAQVRAVSRRERIENLAGAFACPGNVAGQTLAGESLILVDDVSTTGSTLAACAAALKENGASMVWGLTLCKEGIQRPLPDTKEPFP